MTATLDRRLLKDALDCFKLSSDITASSTGLLRLMPGKVAASAAGTCITVTDARLTELPECVVPYQALATVINAIDDRHIDIDLQGTELLISWMNGRTRIPLAWFEHAAPLIPDAPMVGGFQPHEWQTVVEITEAADWKAKGGIAQLENIQIHRDTDTVTVTATDRYRAARAIFPIEVVDEPTPNPGLFNAATVINFDQLLRHLGQESATVFVGWTHLDYAAGINPSMTLHSHLGGFMVTLTQYRDIGPFASVDSLLTHPEGLHRAQFNTKRLRKTLDLMTRYPAGLYEWHCADGVATIVDRAIEAAGGYHSTQAVPGPGSHGQGHLELKLPYTGDMPDCVTIHPRFLVDGIKHLTTDTITIGWSERSKPLFINPDEAQRTYVIAPINALANAAQVNP